MLHWQARRGKQAMGHALGGIPRVQAVPPAWGGLAPGFEQPLTCPSNKMSEDCGLWKSVEPGWTKVLPESVGMQGGSKFSRS